METVIPSLTFFLLILVPAPIYSVCNDVDPSLPRYSIPSPMPLSPCVPNAPIGMYALGNGNTMNGILENTTFVDGYSWWSWNLIEVAKGVYNFSEVDIMVAILSGLDQKLSLDFYWSDAGDPSYIVHEASCKYTWTHRVTVHRACPWDQALQAAWKQFVIALASHQQPSPSGGMVAFADHPTLRVLNFGIPGLGAVPPTATIHPSTKYRITLASPSFKRCYYRWIRSSTPSPPRVTFWDSGMSQIRLPTQSCGESCLMPSRPIPLHIKPHGSVPGKPC